MEKINVDFCNESAKNIFRDMLVSKLNNKKGEDNKINIPKDYLLKLILVEEDIYNVESYDLLLEFYKSLLINVDLSEINWNEIPENILSTFRKALVEVLNDGDYNSNYKLKLPNSFLHRILFSTFNFSYKDRILETKMVPLFDGINLRNLDLSNINFDFVVWDLEEFVDNNLINRGKDVDFNFNNWRLFCETVGIIIDDLNDDVKLYDEQYLEKLDNMDEEDMDNYDLDENDDEHGFIFSKPPFISNPQSQYMNLYKNMLRSDVLSMCQIDGSVDLSYTNANINFRNYKRGLPIYKCNFEGVDLSNSGLDECTFVNVTQVNFKNTGLRLNNIDSESYFAVCDFSNNNYSDIVFPSDWFDEQHNFYQCNFSNSRLNIMLPRQIEFKNPYLGYMIKHRMLDNCFINNRKIRAPEEIQKDKEELIRTLKKHD